MLEFVEQLAEQVAIIVKGQVVCCRTVEDIKRSGMTLEEIYFTYAGKPVGGEPGMAGAALIFTYQWRAHWRRLVRVRDRTQFYLFALAVLAWVVVGLLPARLSQAARELSAGRTASMEGVLLIVCLVWLVVLLEQPPFVISSQHLLRFPLNVRSLIGVRILSVLLPGGAAGARRFCRQPRPVRVRTEPGARHRRRRMAGAYHASLQYAGTRLERRRDIITFLLS